MSSRKEQLRIWSVGIGCAVMAALKALPFSVLSIFSLPMCEELGVSMGSISIIFSAVSVGTLIMSLAIGRIFATAPTKLLVVVGGVSTLVFPVIIGIAHSVTPVITAGITFGFLGSLASSTMAQIIISKWFVKARGIMMSVVPACSTALSTISFPILTRLIQTHGYRLVAVWLGILLGGAIILLGLFVVVGSPDQVGLKPYGCREEFSGAGSQGQPIHQEISGIPLRQIFRTTVFWWFLLMGFLVGCSMEIYNSQESSFYQSIGLTAMETGLILSLNTLAGSAGNLLFGIISDKKSSAAAAYIQGLPATVVFLAVSLWKGWVGAVICSVCFGVMNGTALFGPIMLPKLFGTEQSASMIGIFYTAVCLGNVLGPILSGFLFDIYKNYVMPFQIAGIMMAIMLVAAFRVTHQESV